MNEQYVYALQDAYEQLIESRQAYEDAVENIRKILDAIYADVDSCY